MSDLKNKDYVITRKALEEAELAYHTSEIDFHGFKDVPVNGKPYRIYNPFILTITYAENLAVLNRGAGEPYTTFDGQTFQESNPEVVNGSIFYEPYVEGYEKGVKDIKKRLHITSDVFRTSEAQNTIEELHVHYFHSEGGKGWNAWKTNKTQTLSYNNLYQFGYYAGLMRKVDQFVGEFPLRFQDFHKCTTEEAEGMPEPKPGNGEDITVAVAEDATDANLVTVPDESDDPKSTLISHGEDEVQDISTPENPPKTPEPKGLDAKKIFIKDKEDLYKDMVDSFEDSDRENLKALIIEGKQLDDKLVFNSSCTALGEIFKKRLKVKDKMITTEMNLVAEWIVEHFKYTRKGRSYNIEYDTIYYYLRRGERNA